MECYIEKKRFLFILIIPFVILPIFINELVNMYYINTGCFLSSVIIFVNFPLLVTVLHMKPVRYEDLNDKKGIDPKKYQRWFITIQVVLSSIFFVSIIDYFIYKIQTSQLTFLEKFGVFGGAFSLFIKIINHVGSAVVVSLNYKKKIDIRRNSASLESGIELSEKKETSEN